MEKLIKLIMAIVEGILKGSKSTNPSQVIEPVEPHQENEVPEPEVPDEYEDTDDWAGEARVVESVVDSTSKIILRFGNSGPEVTEFQHLLRTKGFNLKVTGKFGIQEEEAVIVLQRLNLNTVTGYVTKQFLQVIEGMPTVASLTDKDYQEAALSLGTDIPSIRAIVSVESKGNGFLQPNKPVILFERHIMLRRMKVNNTYREAFEKEYPNLVNKEPGGYKGGMFEYDRLKLASTIDKRSALEATSWGLFQLMGFRYDHMGFANVFEMVDYVSASESNQLRAFVKFIKYDDKLHKALVMRDWPTFASIYNGPNYKINDYDTKLAMAYNAYADTKTA